MMLSQKVIPPNFSVLSEAQAARENFFVQMFEPPLETETLYDRDLSEVLFLHVNACPHPRGNLISWIHRAAPSSIQPRHDTLQLPSLGAFEGQIVKVIFMG